MKNKKLNYSVCTDAVFMHTGISCTDAIRQVAELGFEAVEFWSWWDKDIDAMEKELERTGLRAATFCTRFVNPGDKELQEAYLGGLKESFAVAERLHCRTIIAQAGWEFESFPKGITREEHRKTLIETMKRSGELAVAQGVTIVVEPLNLLNDHPGYHLSTSADAFDLMDKIDCPNVKILFDIYHQQITEGNLIRNICSSIGKIGHFHAAGNPGRGELTEGEIHYPHVLSAIAEEGYTGYVGLEYMVDHDPVPGLIDTVEKILV
ncbi:MAG: TIM barrel protein [Blautia sp.]|nr:TIM barrel protein [Blautia sp.]